MGRRNPKFPGVGRRPQGALEVIEFLRHQGPQGQAGLKAIADAYEDLALRAEAKRHPEAAALFAETAEDAKSAAADSEDARGDRRRSR